MTFPLRSSCFVFYPYTYITRNQKKDLVIFNVMVVVAGDDSKGNKVSKWVVNVENIIYEREVLLKASIISACVSDFRLNMKSLSWQYKSKLSPLY